ncbi:unnamed protein product [Moneuplotes crassus]|uniref:Importin N-terminal domain-containing protein n=1 Tax=Euplotes crassus TaxID=5936 RepID=A0AAD1XGY7_EUPCR|nr:unnamed protein product [Moneuplotes crassus]
MNIGPDLSNAEIVTQLCEALENSLSPDNEIRRNAEKFVVDSMPMNGFCSAMLHIATEKKYMEGRKVNVAQAAAIQLKNMAEFYWRFKSVEHAQSVTVPGERYIIIQDEDKDYFRNNILELTLKCDDEAVTRQLNYAVHCIVRLDFPEKWPALATQIQEYIFQEEDENKIILGIESLGSVCRRYEHEYDKARDPLNEIVNTLFPKLEEIFGKIQDNSSAVANLIKFKIAELFYLTNHLEICKRYHGQEEFAKLMNFFKFIIEGNIDESLVTKTDDSDIIFKRKKSNEWKIKTIAMRFFLRTFQRYGNSKMFDEKDDKEFFDHICSTYNTVMIDCAYAVVAQSQDYFISPDLLGYAIKVCTQSLKIPNTKDYLLPKSKEIIENYMIPMVQVTNKDIEDFYDNPVDFIRKMKDVTETFYSCRYSAIEFILVVLSLGETPDQGNETLDQFIQYIVDHLDQSSTDNEEAFKSRDGFLFILEQFHLFFRGKLDYFPKVEEIIQKFAFPDLKSENGLVKFRACKLYEQLSMCVQDLEHSKAASEIIFELLKDNDIAVRIAASGALQKMIGKSSLKPIFAPQLGIILETFLEIMNDFENEELVNSLDRIVEIYADSIGPFAIQICEKVSESYWRMLEIDEECAEGELGAMGCVTIIKTIFQSVQKDQDLLLRLEKICARVFAHCTTPDGMDSIEDVVACECLIMHHFNVITEEIWGIAPQLLNVIIGPDDEEEGGFGFEHISSMVDFFRNILRLGGEQLWTRKIGDHAFIDVFLHGMKKCIKITNNFDYSQTGTLSVFMIMTSFFENNPGLIDKELSEFIELTINELVKEETASYAAKVMCEFLFTCLYYNAGLMFQVLNNLNAIESVSKALFGNLQQFKSISATSTVIYGITSILRLPVGDLPGPIKEEMTSIFTALLDLIQQYSSAKTEDEKEEEEDADPLENAHEDEEDYYDDFPDGEDDIYDDEHMIKDAILGLYKGVFELTPAPLFFKQVFSEIQTTNAEMYESCVQLISSDRQTTLQSIFDQCEQSR